MKKGLVSRPRAAALGLICGLVLAGVNAITAPVIAENEYRAKLAILSEFYDVEILQRRTDRTLRGDRLRLPSQKQNHQPTRKGRLLGQSLRVSVRHRDVDRDQRGLDRRPIQGRQPRRNRRHRRRHRRLRLPDGGRKHRQSRRLRRTVRDVLGRAPYALASNWSARAPRSISPA
ncbi:MAG: hypothetical protein MZU97_09925 [Bacillus subtilis]|nr:hypothetical protein [Bacillus subtilis]